MIPSSIYLAYQNWEQTEAVTDWVDDVDAVAVARDVASQRVDEVPSCLLGMAVAANHEDSLQEVATRAGLSHAGRLCAEAARDAETVRVSAALDATEADELVGTEDLARVASDSILRDSAETDVLGAHGSHQEREAQLGRASLSWLARVEVDPNACRQDRLESLRLDKYEGRRTLRLARQRSSVRRDVPRSGPRQSSRPSRRDGGGPVRPRPRAHQMFDR